jgi:tetratricopeptide (TPR) repeat protein
MEGLTYDPIRGSDPRMETVYANFRRNLDDIRSVALAADARILFASVVTNLVDFAPFGSEHRIDLSEAESREWGERFRSGSVALEVGDLRRAVTLLTEAVEIDPEHAETRFKLGKAYLESGDRSRAATHLVLARDLDAIRLRSDSTLNAIIEEVARRDQDGRVSFLDTAALGEDGLHGREHLLEHVHFSSEGSDWLARTLFDAIVDGVTRDTGHTAGRVDLSADDLSLAIFDVPPVRVPSLERLERLVSSPPFRGRYRNEELVKSIRQRIDRLEATPFAMSDAVLSWLSEDPDDFASHRRAFEYLVGRIRDARATDDAAQVSELLAWAERLAAIPGANQDLRLRRAQWSQQLGRSR